MAVPGPGCGGGAPEEPGLGQPGSCWDRWQRRGPAGSARAVCDEGERAGGRLATVPCCGAVRLGNPGWAGISRAVGAGSFRFPDWLVIIFSLWICVYSLAGVPSRVCVTFC